eukprot:TRINITY_DN9141_c0_g1_i1.p1 TRINITY_DN9141_c0_g1~~TRINITY_DN9141_c0_g1_i1.p1  ORF type:complete len:301 (-),score=64.98 TRINITY_DN9141_c0_g1_i1:3-905(-)
MFRIASLVTSVRCQTVFSPKTSFVLDYVAPKILSSRILRPFFPVRNFHHRTIMRSQHIENPQPNQPKKTEQKGPVTWFSLGVTAVVLGFLVGGYTLVKKKKDQEFKAKTQKSIGKPMIGGPFTLVDHTGFPVTNSTYKGKFMLIYFGFTNCPDICPTELTKMTKALNRVDEAGLGELVQPLFVSVDPLRDNVAQVRKYIKDYHPNLIGLTGTPDQVQKACKSYRVYYSKAREEEGLKDDDDYLLDHSIVLYFMDTEGEILDYFGIDVNDAKMAERMLNHIQTFMDTIKPVSYTHLTLPTT